VVVAVTIPVVLAITFLGMRIATSSCTASPSARSSSRSACWSTTMIAVEMMARKLEEG
jgi:hypothetical protein